MIRGIVKVGGTYGDTIMALQEARRNGYLEAKLVVNALPRTGRKYHRDENDTETEKSESHIRVASPVPELFSDLLDKVDKKPRYEPDEIPPEPAEKGESEESFLGRMTNWFKP